MLRNFVQSLFYCTANVFKMISYLFDKIFVAVFLLDSIYSTLIDMQISYV